MEVVQLDYHVTPFRAQRFAELYWPVVPRVLAYGAPDDQARAEHGKQGVRHEAADHPGAQRDPVSMTECVEQGNGPGEALRRGYG